MLTEHAIAKAKVTWAFLRIGFCGVIIMVLCGIPLFVKNPFHDLRPLPIELLGTAVNHSVTMFKLDQNKAQQTTLITFFSMGILNIIAAALMFLCHLKEKRTVQKFGAMLLGVPTVIMLCMVIYFGVTQQKTINKLKHEVNETMFNSVFGAELGMKLNCTFNNVLGNSANTFGSVNNIAPGFFANLFGPTESCVTVLFHQLWQYHYLTVTFLVILLIDCGLIKSGLTFSLDWLTNLEKNG